MWVYVGGWGTRETLARADRGAGCRRCAPLLPHLVGVKIPQQVRSKSHGHAVAAREGDGGEALRKYGRVRGEVNASSPRKLKGQR